MAYMMATISLPCNKKINGPNDIAARRRRYGRLLKLDSVRWLDTYAHAQAFTWIVVQS